MVATALHGPSSFDGKIKQVEGANFFSTQNVADFFKNGKRSLTHLVWKLILQSNTMITFCEKNVEVALCSFILVNSRWAVTNFYHTFPWNFSSFTLITIIQRYHPNNCSNKSRRSAITGPVTVYQLLNKTKKTKILENTRKQTYQFVHSECQYLLL